MALSEELLAIRLELKGVREAVSGLHSVDEAQKGVATTTTRTGTAAEKAEKKTSRLSKAYASLGKTARWGIGFLGVGGVFALKNAIENTEELAKSTSSLSRNFGFQTNVASRWAAVMHSREVDPKALSMAFGTLSSKMVEAGRKGGTALTPFHQLGLTQEEVTKGAHDFEWGIMRVAKALGEEEGGAKRSTAAKALLGKGFQTLTPLFSEGVKGLKEQLNWADKYGVTLSTTTKDGLMGIVSAQRESKVAMLGLQIAMTKALMPAIEGGQHELQKFIQTLNDPDLTADQKINRIEAQFESLEDKLVEVIGDALPKVAESGGVLGVKLAGAIWTGFTHSGLAGKLVITAWLLKFMGGSGLIRSAGGSVGRMLALALVGAFLPRLAEEFAVTGSVGLMLKARFQNLGKVSGRFFAIGAVIGIATSAYWLGTEIGNHLSEETKQSMHKWGLNAGQNFVNGLIKYINTGIREINAALDDANIFSVLGVDAPNIGEVGEVNFHSQQERQEQGVHNAPPGSINGPGGSIIGPGGKVIAPPVTKPPKHHAGTPRLPRLSFGAFGSGQPIILHNHIHLDGKEIALSTARHTLAAEALA